MTNVSKPLKNLYLIVYKNPLQKPYCHVYRRLIVCESTAERALQYHPHPQTGYMPHFDLQSKALDILFPDININSSFDKIWDDITRLSDKTYTAMEWNNANTDEIYLKRLKEYIENPDSIEFPAHHLIDMQQGLGSYADTGPAGDWAFTKKQLDVTYLATLPDETELKTGDILISS